MHSIVEQFIKTDDTLSDILKRDNSNNPTVLLIKEIRASFGLITESKMPLAEIDQIKKIYLKAEAFSNLNDEDDKHLLYLFYSAWALLSDEMGRGNDCKIIYDRSLNILKNPPPVLASILMRFKNATLDKSKIKKKTLQFVIKNFDSSPRFLLFFLIAILKYSQEGLGEEVLFYIDKFVSTKLNYEHQWHYTAFKLENKLELGSTDGCDEFIDKHQELLDKNYLASRRSFNRTAYHYKLLKGELTVDKIMDSDLSYTNKTLFLSNYYLINGEINKAIDAYTLEKLSVVIDTNSLFLSQTSIRLKLVNREPKSAESILNLKIKEYGNHFFDDFSRARIALLNGNEKRSESYFKLVYEECQKRNALVLIDLELEMALELEHGQVRKLMSSTFQKGNVPIKINAEKKVISEELLGVERIIGESKVIKQIKDQIKKIANINMPVLIMGETGVGKDVVATAIHETSENAKEPFLPINCGALLETLLLSELNGHEVGAFTGAIQNKKGIFESAGKGTAFLDEFGEISEIVQVALLRTLESGTIRPVGSSQTIPFHCRVIAATNKNLEELVAQKKFREDLFYRINSFVIIVPPLRERPEDILLLFDFFLKKHGKSLKENISTELLEALQEYDWPGNIRELKNETDKMCLMHLDKDFFSINEFYVLKEKFEKSVSVSTVKEMINAEEKENRISKKESYSLEEKIKTVLSKTNNSRSRKKILKEAFRKCSELTRQEIIGIMEISPATATNDLKALIAEDFIEKIQPTPAPRTHYFKIKNK